MLTSLKEPNPKMAEQNKNIPLGMSLPELFHFIKTKLLSESETGPENSEKLYDRDGNFMYVWNYDNIPLPVLPFIKESMPILPNFQVRDDDVFICAFPSSGTFLYLLLHFVVRLEFCGPKYHINFIFVLSYLYYFTF